MFRSAPRLGQQAPILVLVHGRGHRLKSRIHLDDRSRQRPVPEFRLEMPRTVVVHPGRRGEDGFQVRIAGARSPKLDLGLDRVAEHANLAVAPWLSRDPIEDLIRLAGKPRAPVDTFPKEAPVPGRSTTMTA